MANRKTIAAAFGVIGLVATLIGALIATRQLVGGDGAVAGIPHPVWTEVQWPFVMDQWGKGEAFQCRARDCGVQVRLYLRAKVGFCNCTTGVADDTELDRLSDFDFMGTEIAALGEGRPIAIAWMKGRSRSYAISRPVRGGKSALSLAFNERCDAVVATVAIEGDKPAVIEPHIVEFLNSKSVLHWIEVTLGL